jgi:hypothetical protein
MVTLSGKSSPPKSINIRPIVHIIIIIVNKCSENTSIANVNYVVYNGKIVPFLRSVPAEVQRLASRHSRFTPPPPKETVPWFGGPQIRSGRCEEQIKNHSLSRT